MIRRIIPLKVCDLVSTWRVLGVRLSGSMALMIGPTRFEVNTGYILCLIAL